MAGGAVRKAARRSATGAQGGGTRVSVSAKRRLNSPAAAAHVLARLLAHIHTHTHFSFHVHTCPAAIQGALRCNESASSPVWLCAQQPYANHLPTRQGRRARESGPRRRPRGARRR
eukprot:15442871-Alexandrium_andersonii.AAC.1